MNKQNQRPEQTPPRTHRFKASFVKYWPWGLFLLLCLGMPQPVLAHSVSKRFGDFYGGMLHPLTALEHLLPILAFSLLAGQHGPGHARRVLLLFGAGLLVGASMAPCAEPIPFVVEGNQLSIVVLGLLVAAAVGLPLAFLMAAALVLGLSHGYQNAVGLSPSVAVSLFIPGVVLSGLSLLAVVAAVAVSLKAPWQRVAVRVAGSWIAAIGILVMGLDSGQDLPANNDPKSGKAPAQSVSMQSRPPATASSQNLS